MPESPVKQLDQRCCRAYDDGRGWRSQWDELYTFALPNRRPAQAIKGTENADNSALVFDATATKAAFRFAGRVQRDAVPPFQKFVELKLGPASKAALAANVPEEQRSDVVQETAKLLDQIVEIGHGILESSNFALASGEAFLDYFGGQLVLLMLEDEDQIAQFVAVPASSVALREDGKGKVIGIYWRSLFTLSCIPYEWPSPTIHDQLQKKIDSEPNNQVPIVQATEWNAKTKKWDFTVYDPDGLDKPPLYELKGMLVCNWLTPRFYKVPGEAYGRGPGLMALPTIKTLNKVTELTLKAVAFAILGLWTYRNDRVFNPRMARMAPGEMWAVSANDGPFGPALKRQDVPGRYDISNIVLQDLREQVKQTTYDDTLPPDSGAVRSATEIVERMKRLMADLASVYPRLMREFIIPLWQWLIDVMYRRRLINTQLPIDQLVTKLTITSPIARAQQAQDVSNIVDWLQIILSTGGQEALMLSAKIEDVFAYLGEKLGVPPELIRSSGERKGLMTMVAQMIAQNQMKAAGVVGGGPGGQSGQSGQVVPPAQAGAQMRAAA